MNVRTHLTDTDLIAGKHTIDPIPNLRVWQQLSDQQQSQLAKHWAQLLGRMQLAVQRSREVQDVEG